MNIKKWKWMNKKKVLEHVISEEHIPVGLTDFDNNLRWEILKDEAKLSGFCK